ncbi:aspartic peptidase domain-containing protein [Podospora didyma]|uniref:Aspartic peptidase domain-containing protein n=1 Tax=Podospora didyma TaxID=330526 RepID=A0AAE0U8P0_9PEZI|nr:aspartic peptidase domain-containing protein [Podospora didyma]
MKFFEHAVAAISLLSSASLVAGAPHVFEVTPKEFKVSTLGGATFKISQVYNTNFKQAGKGPRALGKVYSKFGVDFPPELAAVLKALLDQLRIKPLGNGRNMSGVGWNQTTGVNQTYGSPDVDEDDQGEVAATPNGLFDTEYLAPVEIGTPPQTLMLNFDTGSSDMWVFSSDTPRNLQTGHVLYDVTKSSTAKLLEGETWAIRYGDGSNSSGNVYLDTVTIGGVTVENQAVESALDVSASFRQDTASSGLVGLAFDSLNTIAPTSQKTFFSNALETLAMPLFTANLKRGEAGNYNFGFIDPTEFTGPISFVDVNKTSGFWQFEADGFSVGNGEAITNRHKAIADTGTTLLLLPNSIVENYYRRVLSARYSMTDGGYVFSCNETLPDLTLNIGTYKAVVPGDFIRFAPTVGETFEGADSCYGGLQSQGNINVAIYGDVFLKAQFTVFHAGDSKVGFAPKPQ